MAVKTCWMEVSKADRSELEAWLRSQTIPQALAMRARFNLHFTPTSASWLNLVERRFDLISEQAIRRGSFGSVAQLERVITRFVEHWNQNARPLAWAKTAQQIRRSIRNAKLISET
jgi:putative transposase